MAHNNFQRQHWCATTLLCNISTIGNVNVCQTKLRRYSNSFRFMQRHCSCQQPNGRKTNSVKRENVSPDPDPTAKQTIQGLVRMHETQTMVWGDSFSSITLWLILWLSDWLTEWQDVWLFCWKDFSIYSIALKMLCIDYRTHTHTPNPHVFHKIKYCRTVSIFLTFLPLRNNTFIWILVSVFIYLLLLFISIDCKSKWKVK